VKLSVFIDFTFTLSVLFHFVSVDAKFVLVILRFHFVSVDAKLFEEYKSKNKVGRDEMIRRYGQRMIDEMLKTNASEQFIQDSGGKQCPSCKYYIQVSYLFNILNVFSM